MNAAISPKNVALIIAALPWLRMLLIILLSTHPSLYAHIMLFYYTFVGL